MAELRETADFFMGLLLFEDALRALSATLPWSGQKLRGQVIKVSGPGIIP
jgi:hypothetical protein